MGRITTGNHVLSHSPNSGGQGAQADHSFLSGSSLRGSNSPTPKINTALALWCLSLTAECRVTILITKGDSHRHKSLAMGGAE